MQATTAKRKRRRRRAIYDDQKEARREAILAAARQLFVKRKGQLPTMMEVARRARLAKGTVYLYFQTREELYVAYYEQLMLSLLERLRALGAEGGDTLRERIVAAIGEFVDAHPELLRLGSLMNGVLEQNVSDDFVEGYKTRLGTALLATARQLTAALAPLSMEQASRLLLQTYAFAVGLWQQADTPSVVSRLLERRPDLAFYRIDFATELREALRLVWLR